jgi:hypothetical protein
MPFEIVFGFRSTMQSVLEENPGIQYKYDELLAELKCRLETAHSIARERLIDHKEKSKVLRQKHERNCISDRR